MGNLPSLRVFSNCDLDYAGPFILKDGKYRNRKYLKSYVCVFVCLAAKMIHHELASELTSEWFMAVLRRFASRRGCTTMFTLIMAQISLEQTTIKKYNQNTG